MKIYAKNGESQQNMLPVGITKKMAGLSSDFILMKSERPTPKHIATPSGLWAIPDPEQANLDSRA